jgi:CRP-like cAMP-binding protein
MFNTKRFSNVTSQGDLIFNSRFLENLTSLERVEFLQYCHRRNYKKNEYIYYQGDPGTGMYFIEKGKVELIVDPEPGSEVDGENFIISAPESFGALSIGYDLRRISNAKCLTECTLLGFFKPDFETLKRRHPTIALKFMEKLATLAMKQLEVMTNELKKVSGSSRAFTLQFETYLTHQQKDSV